MGYHPKRMGLPGAGVSDWHVRDGRSCGSPNVVGAVPVLMTTAGAEIQEVLFLAVNPIDEPISFEFLNDGIVDEVIHCDFDSRVGLARFLD